MTSSFTSHLKTELVQLEAISKVEIL
jgi:hypothetical protein